VPQSNVHFVLELSIENSYLKSGVKTKDLNDIGTYFKCLVFTYHNINQVIDKLICKQDVN